MLQTQLATVPSTARVPCSNNHTSSFPSIPDEIPQELAALLSGCNDVQSMSVSVNFYN